MRIFEPHVHMVSRITDDYVAMAAAGVEVVLEPAFWLGQPRTRVGSFVDYFEHLLGYEVARAKQFGIEHVCTLSLNPREANDRKLAEEVLAILPGYLERDRVVGVGEIGFDDVTEAETEALRRQLVMAMDAGLPALVHTPHRKKAFGTQRTIDVCREVGFPFEKLLLDHATEESIRMIVESGAWAGFTVYPNTKLTPERCTNILKEYGVERMTVNSSADWGPSTTLSVPYVLAEMRRRGFDEAARRRLAWENPCRFYAQSGKLASVVPNP
ncbi:MAG TPA: TatD family hydrolase [Planctomycetota bacterium]|nr:TatD family hydrolase [Planctomycetota bacterium]